jgi:hypothetical protein
MHIHRQGSDPDIQLTACGSITEESLPSKESSDILFACSLIHKVKKIIPKIIAFFTFFLDQSNIRHEPAACTHGNKNIQRVVTAKAVHLIV